QQSRDGSCPTSEICGVTALASTSTKSGDTQKDFLRSAASGRTNGPKRASARSKNALISMFGGKERFTFVLPWEDDSGAGWPNASAGPVRVWLLTRRSIGSPLGHCAVRDAPLCIGAAHFWLAHNPRRQNGWGGNTMARADESIAAWGAVQPSVTVAASARL